MDKYVRMDRFHHYRQLQVYIYAFMYIDSDTMQVEDSFPYAKTFVKNYNKISTPGPVPKHWLRFSYVLSKYIELDNNSDEI